MEYNESGHCKEVYAHFGLAYYASSVWEAGLTNAIMQADFLIQWKSKIDRQGKGSFDRKVYEAEFDAFMKNQEDQTLGNLIKRFAKTLPVSNELQEKISEAKKKRDFLAHGYFRERAAQFMNRDGRDRMIAELWEMGEVFRSVDHEIEALVAPIFSQIGISREVVDKFTAQYFEKAERGEL